MLRLLRLALGTFTLLGGLAFGATQAFAVTATGITNFSFTVPTQVQFSTASTVTGTLTGNVASGTAAQTLATNNATGANVAVSMAGNFTCASPCSASIPNGNGQVNVSPCPYGGPTGSCSPVNSLTPGNQQYLNRTSAPSH